MPEGIILWDFHNASDKETYELISKQPVLYIWEMLTMVQVLISTF